jgi:hypothetical protein
MTCAAAEAVVKRTRQALGVVVPPFVVAKLLTLATMLVSISRNGGVSWANLRAAFLHWDAISYVDIAAHGYPGHLDYHDAFLPGYPLLIRAASVVTGDLVSGGVLVSAAAELAALVAVLLLVRRERDESSARFAVWAVALLPLAFFFTGVYTESPFIAGAALALLLMRAGRFRAAALAAALAVAMRVTGMVLLPVMLFELIRQGRVRTEGVWLAVAALPLVLYGAYMQLRTGDALALVHAESLPSFGEALAWPWDGLRLTWETAATSSDPTNRDIFIREIAAGLVGAVVVAACWLDARFPRSFAVYCTLVWLLAVSLSFWRSVPRYDLALFPAVIVVADATRRVQMVRPLILAASGAMLAWGAFVFAEGGWIG